jgi:predicted enzyme related to lactoylglutathione lyase
MIELRYIIIKVKNLGRAKEFYKQLLGDEPIKDETGRMIVFKCGSVKVGLYNPLADDFTLKDSDFGNTCYPAFGTDDLNAELKRVSGFAKIISHKKITYHEWFEFEDSEGNILEIHKR